MGRRRAENRGKEGGLYEIRVKAHFDAAHYLLNYEGPCANMHGHTWRVEAAVVGSQLGRADLLIDFHDLRDLLKQIIAPFDHGCLNDLEPFRDLSPTSENIAHFIHDELRERLSGFSGKITLAWISVSESAETMVVYREEG